MSYETLRVTAQQQTVFIQIHRPEANNTINELLIEEFHRALDACEDTATVIVLEGLPDVFCFGADFQDMHDAMAQGRTVERDPGRLYDLWLRLATGPYVTVSHVRGKVNAGGIGFVAASDIVVAERSAMFSLSELLFGVFPAAVLPFLIRRIGHAKANYLTVMTQPVSAEQAMAWGLVDACHDDSRTLLRKHLLRLKPLAKRGIQRYKRYMETISAPLLQSKGPAVAANKEMFADPHNLAGIFRYIDKGKFPWEE